MNKPLRHHDWTSALALAIGLWLGVATTQPVHAQTYELLHAFTGYPSDGRFPEAGLFRDAAGNLYGTTYYGGSACPGYGGCGTVFKVDATGKETVLHSFTGGADGQFPVARLVMDAVRNLYGTTQVGGTPGYGTVFKLSRTGKKTVLHNFSNSDGAYPTGGLVMDAAGNLYGTAWQGGNFNCLSSGCGTIFKVSGRTRKTTVLYSFATYADGVYPVARVILDSAGNLYGTTEGGGVYGGGTVFKLDKRGNETVLYSFTGGSDGFSPRGVLVRDEKGNLFGTTGGGGAYDNGTVFKLTEGGKETVLYSFTGGADGGRPISGLVFGKGGDLYGTTAVGAGGGTLFKVSRTGQETTLYTFSGDGSYGGLAGNAAGGFYGTTLGGSDNNQGTVFKFTP